jgi:hypothetical protein
VKVPRWVYDNLRMLHSDIIRKGMRVLPENLSQPSWCVRCGASSRAGSCCALCGYSYYEPGAVGITKGMLMGIAVAALALKMERGARALAWKEKRQEKLPRRDPDMDWGVERRVVARTQDGLRMIFWSPSSLRRTAASRRCVPGYLGATDELANDGFRIVEGGRLSEHLRSASVLRKIATHFGMQPSKLPRFKQNVTYVLS